MGAPTAQDGERELLKLSLAFVYRTTEGSARVTNTTDDKVHPGFGWPFETCGFKGVA